MPARCRLIWLSIIPLLLAAMFLATGLIVSPKEREGTLMMVEGRGGRLSPERNVQLLQKMRDQGYNVPASMIEEVQQQASTSLRRQRMARMLYAFATASFVAGVLVFFFTGGFRVAMNCVAGTRAPRAEAEGKRQRLPAGADDKETPSAKGCNMRPRYNKYGQRTGMSAEEFAALRAARVDPSPTQSQIAPKQGDMPMHVLGLWARQACRAKASVRLPWRQVAQLIDVLTQAVEESRSGKPCSMDELREAMTLKCATCSFEDSQAINILYLREHVGGLVGSGSLAALASSGLCPRCRSDAVKVSFSPAKMGLEDMRTEGEASRTHSNGDTGTVGPPQTDAAPANKNPTAPAVQNAKRGVVLRSQLPERFRAELLALRGRLASLSVTPDEQARRELESRNASGIRLHGKQVISVQIREGNCEEVYLALLECIVADLSEGAWNVTVEEVPVVSAEEASTVNEALNKLALRDQHPADVGLMAYREKDLARRLRKHHKHVEDSSGSGKLPIRKVIVKVHFQQAFGPHDIVRIGDDRYYLMPCRQRTASPQ